MFDDPIYDDTYDDAPQKVKPKRKKMNKKNDEEYFRIRVNRHKLTERELDELFLGEEDE